MGVQDGTCDTLLLGFVIITFAAQLVTVEFFFYLLLAHLN